MLRTKILISSSVSHSQLLQADPHLVDEVTRGLRRLRLRMVWGWRRSSPQQLTRHMAAGPRIGQLVNHPDYPHRIIEEPLRRIILPPAAPLPRVLPPPRPSTFDVQRSMVDVRCWALNSPQTWRPSVTLVRGSGDPRTTWRPAHHWGFRAANRVQSRLSAVPRARPS